YDNYGDIVETVLPDNSIRSATYDPLFHRLISSTDGNGYTTVYLVNAYGDTVGMTDALGNTTTYAWAAGLLVGTTDPLGRTTSIAYAGNRRPRALLTPMGEETDLGYDVHGNLASSTDPLHHTTFTLFDNDNRLLQTFTPAGRSSATAYDAPGDPTLSIDPG